MSEFITETGIIFYEVIEATERNRETTAPQAQTLTLLHNFMSSGRAAWGPLLPELSKHYRLLLPDLPGHGRSLGHPSGYVHHAIACQLANMLHAEGAEHSHLAGCSSGGMLAQLLVHHHMVTPATLTLVSTTHSVNPQTTGNTHALTPEHFQAARNWMEATARLHDPHRYPGYYEQELLPGFRHLNGATAIDLPVSALAEFAMPLCIIHGERDEFFPSFIPERMAAAAPNAKLHLVPQQTHALLFRRPWQVAQIMLEFLHNHQQ
jgi:pimeloyl-ACP methyl ester carboxylesterase